jgi:hypothetical protein
MNQDMTDASAATTDCDGDGDISAESEQQIYGNMRGYECYFPTEEVEDDEWGQILNNIKMHESDVALETCDDICKRIIRKKYGEVDVSVVPVDPKRKTLAGCKAYIKPAITIENILLTMVPTLDIPIIESPQFTMMSLRRNYITFRVGSDKSPFYNKLYNTAINLATNTRNKNGPSALRKGALIGTLSYIAKKEKKNRNGVIYVYLSGENPYVKFLPCEGTNIKDEMKSQIQLNVIVTPEEMATIGITIEKDRVYCVKRFLNGSAQVPNCIDDVNFTDLELVLQKLAKYENTILPLMSYVCPNCRSQPIRLMAEYDSYIATTKTVSLREMFEHGPELIHIQSAENSDRHLISDDYRHRISDSINEISAESLTPAAIISTSPDLTSASAAICYCKLREKTEILYERGFTVILQNYGFHIHNIWKIRLDQLYGLLYAKFLRDNKAIIGDAMQTHIDNIMRDDLRRYTHEIDEADRDNKYEKMIEINSIKYTLGNAKMTVYFKINVERRNKKVAVAITNQGKFNIQGSTPGVDIDNIYNYFIEIFHIKRDWYYVDPPTDAEIDDFLENNNISAPSSDPYRDDDVEIDESDDDIAADVLD